MQVSNVSTEDALNLAYIFQLLQAGDKLIKGLRSAGVAFQGEAFEKQAEAFKWLQGISGQMAVQLEAKEKPKAKTSSKASPKPSKKSSTKGKRK